MVITQEDFADCFERDMGISVQDSKIIGEAMDGDSKRQLCKLF